MLNEVKRNLHPFPVGRFKLSLHYTCTLPESFKYGAPKYRIRRKYLFYRPAQQIPPRTPKESFYRSAYEHYPCVTGEQHQTILKIGHDLIDIVFEGGEDFLGIAHLPPQVGDLQGDKTILVVALFRFCYRLRNASGDAIQTAADTLQRTKSDVRQPRRQHQGKQNRGC